MATPRIHILPIRALLSRKAFPGNSIAIISSSDTVDTSGLPIPSCLAYYQDLDYESPRSFTPELAGRIAAFIKSHADSTDHIFVSCQAGQSRSPGIAAALYTYYGRDPMEVFQQPIYQPNVLCYRLLTDALGVPVSDWEIDALIHVNTTAFRNAIRQSRNGSGT